jgi:hypothetical protein
VIERKHLTRIERVVVSETQLGKRSSGNIAACLAYTCQFGKQEMEKAFDKADPPRVDYC